jgi:hypothetical protein
VKKRTADSQLLSSGVEVLRTQRRYERDVREAERALAAITLPR